ncbi:MAG: glycosyltransferase family 2 protein [Gemmatimonadaceae bacterium]
MNPGDRRISYVLPLRAHAPQHEGDLTIYLRRLASHAEVIVVDGSSAEVFAAHARAWAAFATHAAPDAALVTPMGKVGGVLTGLRLASHERVVIADDDVRYDDATLHCVAAALDDADVVRPQNYFHPLPWHACWDTGRTLLNRMTGGDWPGTLAVRRSALRRTNGYDGRAMFENLELVRTVVAAGGTERAMLDAFVERRPSTARHFWSQRIRQAYDELARPARLAVQLAVLPMAVLLARRGGAPAVLALAAVVAIVAEAGRWRANGRSVFSARASLMAPVWLAERAVCSWLALGARLVIGGVPYRGTVLRHAATPMRELRARHSTGGMPPLSPAAPPESA